LNLDILSFDLTQLPDGSLVAVGTYDQLPVVIRIASDGTLDWSKVINVGSGGGEARAVAAASDGTVVVAAEVATPGNGDAVLLARLDATGSTLWRRLYDTPGSDRLQAIVATADGGFVVSGATNAVDGFGRLWLFKVDGAGEIQWQRAYDRSWITLFGHGLDEGPSGELWVGSRIYDYFGNYRPLILKLSEDGVSASCASFETDAAVAIDSSSLVDCCTAYDGSRTDSTTTSSPVSLPFFVESRCDCSDDDGDGFDSCFECNDLDGAVYPGASELNDGLDNQCPGDAGFGLTDEVAGELTVTDDTVCWEAQSGAAFYEVARSSSADFTLQCTVEGESGTCWTDPQSPAPGETVYYLVRPSTPFAGDWGFDSEGAPRDVPCAAQ
jgi:hypothetical protein